MRTSTYSGLRCDSKDIKICMRWRICSIPYAPSWVSTIQRNIWCWSTVVVCTDTFRRKWSSSTSPHLVRHIGMLPKLSKKFKQKKRDFGSANQKQGKGSPKPQNQGHSQGMATQENFPKPQAKSNTAKPKKEEGKWCEFHKRPTHNTSECRAK